MEDQANVAANNSDGQATLVGGVDSTPPAAPPTEEQTPSSEDGAEGSEDSQPSEDTEAPKNAPEKYEFKVPEGTEISEESLEVYAELAKEMDLTQEAAQALVDKLAPTIVQQQQARVDALKQEWLTQSKNDKEFGGKELDANLSIAKAARDKFASKEFIDFLENTGVGNHPEMIRMLYRVGQTLKEDSFVDGRSSDGVSTGPKTFNEQANLLYPNSD